MISDYDPKMLFIPDVPCLKLSTTRTTHASSKRDAAFWYALPGSQIMVTVPENDSTVRDVRHVWIVNMDFYNKSRFCADNGPFPCHNPYKCQDYTDICYPVNSTGAKIVFNITEPGYYRHVYSYSNDSAYLHFNYSQTNVTWIYDNLVYDIDTIQHDYQDLEWRYLVENTQSIFVQVANAFKFHRSSCTLLSLQNSEDTYTPSCIRISVLYRWDLVLLIFIVYLLCVAISVVSVVLGYNIVLRYRKWKKRLVSVNS